MTTENLLVELGTEELPPKALPKLASAFAQAFENGLKDVGLSYKSVTWLASPRRMAIKVEQLAAAAPDRIEEKRGPSVSVAFDANGNATPAAQGWAKGNGITVEQAERLTTDKGEWLLYKVQIKGQGVTELLGEITQKALKQIPIPKPMRWGNSSHEFIRPVHTFTLMYGAQIIAAEILGKQSSNKLQGHRFHSNGLIEINHADEYEEKLEQAKVIADFEKRKAIITEQIKAEAQAHGGVADIDEDLLNEVTALVEWPVTLVGHFDEDFLAVPKEALISTMKDNQKYFPVLSKNGELMSSFIFVSNIQSKDPTQVISGNEKVIRPRLADARFFFNTDRKHSLESRIESLSKVIFQKQLGTVKDKSVRVSQLAAYIAAQLGANAADAERAGLLSKCDLMSEMVMEFPDVQGIMGMHYARFDGENEAVALALNEQYMPRFAGDELPNSHIGCALAIAEKIDTLVGIFSIGQAPKGDKDPFALRRAAIGLLRIMVEKKLPLDLEELATVAQTKFISQGQLTTSNVPDVVDFVLGRFRSWYQEQGIAVDVIQAVAAKRPTLPVDFDARIQAVRHFRTLPQALDLAAANKRVGNILAKIKVADLPDKVDQSLLKETAETALFEALTAAKAKVDPLFASANYQSALVELASLNDVINNFFDKVMVNDDNLKVRENRQAMLAQLHQVFSHVADISTLQ